MAQIAYLHVGAQAIGIDRRCHAPAVGAGTQQWLCASSIDDAGFVCDSLVVDPAQIRILSCGDSVKLL